MKSNFQFLQSGWAGFFSSAGEAEALALNVPRSSVFEARYTLEQVVNWLYNNDDYLVRPYRDNLASLIHEQTFKDNLAPGLFDRIRFIWETGNHAAHKAGEEKPVDSKLSIICLKHLHAFLSWFYKCYSEDSSIPIPAFNESLLPDKKKQEHSFEKIQELQAQLDETNKRLKEQAVENKTLKIRIQKIKEQNKQKVEQTDFNPDTATEEETRWYLIDMLLYEAGWALNSKKDREYEVTGMPNDTGLGYVDYVLWGDNGLPLAVVEAKRTMKDPREGQHQASLYADCLEKMTHQRPLIFYTNGYEIYFWDDKRYPPRMLLGFYTRDELSLAINRRSTIKDFTSLSPGIDIAGRYYQIEAITRTCEAYSSGSRKALLVMATGTGKTRVAISITDMLLRAHWAKRILFLADRNALLSQAQKHFKKHLPHISTVDITKEKEDINTRIIFSTYPTMMNMIDEKKGNNKRFGVGYFDLVIIDEIHRSIYAKYRTIFEYFDSLLLGLTATPKNEIDRNTYKMCGLEDNVPTFAYDYEQAVPDGFLVPYKSLSVPIKFQLQGIKYDELSDEEKQEYEEKFYDDESDSLPPWINPNQLNSWVFNQDTADKVITFLMENGQKVEGGDKLGKTLIFAKNHKHAMFIAERFDALFPHLKGNFLQVIDNQINYAHDLIDKFSLKKENPFIAVSVDMMDTGIDVPEVLNLVFFKIVRSKAKFWQMIGRGTRLCEDLFAPGEDKKFFTIFDFCENFEFFEQNPDGYVAPGQESLTARIFLRRLKLSQIIRRPVLQEDKKYKEYYKVLLYLLHTEVQGIKDNRGETISVRAQGKYIDKYYKREAWENLTKTDLHDIEKYISYLTIPHDNDELARRFDLLILNLQIVIMENEPLQNNYVKDIREIARYLYEKKLSIPSVAKHKKLLLEVISDEYWENLHISSLEEVRTSLRDLIKFIERNTKNPVYTDFEDSFGKVKKSPEIHPATGDLTNYRRKVEKYVQENKDYLVIHKLIFNEKITTYDIHQLEHFLFHGEIGSKEDFEKAYPEETSLGRFIRSIAGLDRNTAKEVFAKYLDKNKFNGNQITFINQVIDYLTQKGILEPSQLFEIPFDKEAIANVFKENEIDEIIDIIEGINLNAEVAV